MKTNQIKATRFETFEAAFSTCRSRNAPLVVVVTEPCNDCCCETQNTTDTGDPHKRPHKLYPSGKAIPLPYAVEMCDTAEEPR